LDFSLLEVLVGSAGQAVSRHELLRRVWSIDADSVSMRRIVDSNISRLMAKLQEHPDDPKLILTCRGVGDMFRRIKSESEQGAVQLAQAVNDLAVWRAKKWGLPGPQS